MSRPKITTGRPSARVMGAGKKDIKLNLTYKERKFELLFKEERGRSQVEKGYFRVKETVCEKLR